MSDFINGQGEILVFFGDALKTLDDKGKIGGYLVAWGSPALTDATGKRDFFTPETDLGRFCKTGVDLLFYHGLPRLSAEVENPLADRILGEVKTTADDAGLWMEGVYKIRDEYEEQVYDGVKKGKMGLSSGAASHMVRRAREAKGSNRVTRWPIVEASITPSPAEPRTQAVALKTLLDSPVAGGSIVDRSERLVADLVELEALWGRAYKTRQDEGRVLSAPKRAALKSLHDRLGAMLSASEPRPSASQVARLEAQFLAFRRQMIG
jgi:hypothetical protein